MCTIRPTKISDLNAITEIYSEAIISEGKRVGLHTIIARIAEGNDVSVHLAGSFGFRHIGVSNCMAELKDRYEIIVIVERTYSQ